MTKRFFIAIVVVILLVGLALFSSHKTSAPNETTPTPNALLSVHTETVFERQSGTFDFSYPGTISNEGEASLIAQVSGTIVSATLSVNAHVSTGQTLYVIDDTSTGLKSNNGTQSADLQQAALALSTAKKAYQEAVRNDHQQGTSSSESAKIQARNSRDMAQIAYTSLFSKRHVKSPIAGTITVKNAVLGDTVSVGTPLATVSRGKKIVRFFVNDTERLLLSPGQELSLSKGTDGHDTIKGKLLRISQTADPASRRFLAEAESTDPGFTSFATGSIVSVSASATKNALTGNFFLPLSAVLRDQNGAAVFAYVDGRAKRLPVEIKNINGETVELSGISDTATRIIMTNVKRLKEGDTVTLAQ